MKFLWGFLIAVILCIAASIIIGASILGKAANVAPPNWESYLVNQLKHLRIPAAPPPAESIARSDENTLTGGEHFNHHCAVCHDLEGDADNKMAKSFYPPVTNLLSKNVQGYSDGQLKWIVDNGIRYTGMPGWKELVDQPTQWKIVYYMRALASPTDAKRFEDMLKEKGAWEVGVPTAPERGEEEAGEEKSGETSGVESGQKASPEQQPGTSSSEGTRSSGESEAEPGEKAEK